jgi:hypothetical protein
MYAIVQFVGQIWDHWYRARVNVTFCEAEQTLFASFSRKRRILLNQLVFYDVDFGGHAPQTPLGRLRRGFGLNVAFCEAELCFLVCSKNTIRPIASSVVINYG